MVTVRALAQAGSQDQPTGLIVALGVILLAVVLLTLRGVLDRWLGPEQPTETYRLVETDGRLALARRSEMEAERLIGLRGATMHRLLEAVEERNELRIHAIVTPEGDERAWQAWRGEQPRAAVQRILVEASKGQVAIDASGRIEATPPLDEAVRRDLVEVLSSILPERA